MMQIPSRQNLDKDYTTILILTSKLYRRFRIDSIFDLFLIKFDQKLLNLISLRSKSQLKDQNVD